MLGKFVFPFIFQLNAKSCQQTEDFRKTFQELSELKAALSSIKQKLAREYGKNEHQGHHRAVIDKIIGCGFASDKTPRTHVADWVSKIQDAYPDDTLKQIQLAEKLAGELCLMKRQTTTTEAESKVADSVKASLQYFYLYVKENHRGRHDNMVRAAEYATSMAVSLVPP